MKVIAAADIGGTAIKVGLMRGSEILARSEIPAFATEGLRPALKRIRNIWLDQATSLGLSASTITGAGLSFPGIVDPRSGQVWITPAGKFDDARDLDLHGWAEEQMRLPLVVCNDAKAALIGEWRYGAARGVANAVMMTSERESAPPY